MKKSIMTLATVFCFSTCLTLSTVASADGNMRGHKKGQGMSFGKVLKELDVALSDEQKLEIKAIAQQTRENNSVYGVEKQEIKLQMRELMNMPAWDAQFAREIISSQMENAQPLVLNKAQAKHAMYQVLSDEQKQALAANAEQKGKRKGKNGGKGKKRQAKMEARLVKALGLSDQQQASWEQNKASGKVLKESFRSVMQDHREQVKQVIQADNFDADTFLALQDGFSETLLEHRVQMAQIKYASLAVLTDDQKQKMKKIKNKMKEKRRS